MIPFSWAASSASAICRAISRASSTGIGPRASALVQALAVHELEHEKLAAIGFVQAVDCGDVRMIQRCQHLCFAPEARHAFRVIGEGVGQDLQRDLAVELGVASAIHLAHSTRAEAREFRRNQGERRLSAACVARLILVMKWLGAKARRRHPLKWASSFSQGMPTDQRTSQREKGLVDVGSFIVTNTETAELIQPGKQSPVK